MRRAGGGRTARIGNRPHVTFQANRTEPHDIARAANLHLNRGRLPHIELARWRLGHPQRVPTIGDTLEQEEAVKFAQGLRDHRATRTDQLQFHAGLSAACCRDKHSLNLSGWQNRQDDGPYCAGTGGDDHAGPGRREIGIRQRRLIDAHQNRNIGAQLVKHGTALGIGDRVVAAQARLDPYIGQQFLIERAAAVAIVVAENGQFSMAVARQPLARESHPPSERIAGKTERDAEL